MNSGRCWCAPTPGPCPTIATTRWTTRPLRTNPGDTEVTVRTSVRRPGQAPVQIDYSMAKTPDGWKAYDVIVAGVSLVTNYRDEFNDAVKSSGVDGLIKMLVDKNKGSAPK